MSTFIVSKINLTNKKVKINEFSERLFSLPSGLSMISVKPIINTNSLMLEIAESISLNFSYLNNPLQVPIITKAIISFEGDGLMVSSPGGIGIVTKGGAKKYIDTYIGRVIAKEIFSNENVYIPFSLTNEQMNPTIWGEELRYLKVSLPDIGNGTIAGKSLTSKIKDLDHLFGNIEQSKILGLKVFSKSLKRTVSISSNGTFRINSDDILSIFDYIKKSIR